jgi:hypothetical protein
MPRHAKAPKIISILKPLTPTDLGDSLEYEFLEETVEKNEPYEQSRLEEVLSAQPHSIEEQTATRQLAYHYLLKTAHNAMNASSESSQARLLDRFTQASIEIFGAPLKKRANQLLSEHIQQFEAFKNSEQVDQVLLEEYLAWLESKRSSDTQANNEEHEVESIENLLVDISGYLYKHYSGALDVFTDENIDEKKTIVEAKEKIETALEKLKAIEPGFSSWKVKIISNKDVISVDPETKTLQLGKNRAAMTNSELKGLFCHELLVHALRSINGAKIDESLAFGLPDYLDTEEGLGTLFEYAITRQMPEKNADRYIDIAIALGTLGETMVPRPELMQYVVMRETLRSQIDVNYAQSEVETKARAHVNRIYRGTPGTEDAIGVFTKDIVYQEGFDTICSYLLGRQKNGVSIDEIIDFVMIGKYNPTSEKEVAYVAKMY